MQPDGQTEGAPPVPFLPAGSAAAAATAAA